MPRHVLDQGVVSFKSEGRLLQELGLRLVASPEVALVELIKNAYDADSVCCVVRLADEDQAIIVEDHGHGMTLDDFMNKWMQIATSSKAREQLSERFGRPLTGAKGIGRFAVRYLGDYLALRSVAHDEKRGHLTILEAEFDWPQLDATADLSKTTVHYKLFSAPTGASTGTTLTIRKLRDGADFVRSRNLRANVLRIVSPIQGLERGHFHRDVGDGALDPGFSVSLPGDEPAVDANLADLVLQHFWARLIISLSRRTLTFSVQFPNRRKPNVLTLQTKSTIKQGLFADIRFFPRRKGVFHGKEVNGRVAWSWVRENSGIAVVDHGFRIKPYGFQDDDWLSLDLDAAHNERDWRSAIAKEHFPISAEVRSRPGDNPALNLPHNFQLVGAVFIESARTPVSTEDNDLIPAMDREGLLGNAGFKELREYVRAGVEYLALCDKKELVRREAEEAESLAESAREDIQQAIRTIKESDTLTGADKARIISQYSALAERLEEQEEYSAQARRSLLTMSLLGVVAGFMTHESDAILHDLSQAARVVESLAKKYTALEEVAALLSRRVVALREYIDYSKLFIKRQHSPDGEEFSAAAQVRYVIKRFKSFADERGIDVRNEVPQDVMAPAVPITAYSGILVNLFTNALKSLIAVRASVKHPRIVFRGWNESGKHVIEVLDNGVGIPHEMRKRIWDPLYTTTATSNNPLGSGMGLGLTLVRQVVSEVGGTVGLLATPPPGFSTCFRVTYPLT